MLDGRAKCIVGAHVVNSVTPQALRAHAEQVQRLAEVPTSQGTKQFLPTVEQKRREPWG
eukprot:CAMPEP_0117609096 /NCGR_PEP_ID=MMETSP0784-20121206/81145_1 /TAXON_ID=39447 /ORGANISM="" /LENGTH=58 /DNA_ID=CAMNT_0005412385 /DNA_START=248 /DNA_END=420 /DNA_ORIENTATION=+